MRWLINNTNQSRNTFGNLAKRLWHKETKSAANTQYKWSTDAQSWWVLQPLGGDVWKWNNLHNLKCRYWPDTKFRAELSEKRNGLLESNSVCSLIGWKKRARVRSSNPGQLANHKVKWVWMSVLCFICSCIKVAVLYASKPPYLMLICQY